MQEPQQATPDTFIAAIACPWLEQDPRAITEAHAEQWQELLTLELEYAQAPAEEEYLGRGLITFEDGAQATLLIEPPTPELIELAPMSAMPYNEPEAILLHQHQSLWRIDLAGGQRLGRRNAKRMAQLWSTFISAGACGVFLPGLIHLHSPGMVRKETIELNNPQALANLFVNAWHEEGWMHTRGLTAFGLPELEIKANKGLNAAYFTLMDVAANMIFQMAPYPQDATLQIGPYHYTIAQGPTGPEDDEVPINGIFGVMTLTSQ